MITFIYIFIFIYLFINLDSISNECIDKRDDVTHQDKIQQFLTLL
jgi:hypothetical protein